ncbi:MAG: hypothetical protein ACXIVQ_02840 [Acidimicrobiales bacterium]
MNSEAERVTWGQMMPRTVKVGAVVAVVALVVGVGVVRWWPSREVATPQVIEIGFTSDDMESLFIASPLGSGTIFRCAPGSFQMSVGLADGGDAVELVDVSMPWLDQEWVENGMAERTSTQVMRDPYGDLDDLVDFTGWDLSPEDGDWARMRITWEIAECGDMSAGITSFHDIGVSYRAGGRTHHAHVPLGEPLRLTTQDLDELSDQVTVDRR